MAWIQEKQQLAIQVDGESVNFNHMLTNMQQALVGHLKGNFANNQMGDEVVAKLEEADYAGLPCGLRQVLGLAITDRKAVRGVSKQIRKYSEAFLQHDDRERIFTKGSDVGQGLVKACKEVLKCSVKNKKKDDATETAEEPRGRWNGGDASREPSPISVSPKKAASVEPSRDENNEPSRSRSRSKSKSKSRSPSPRDKSRSKSRSKSRRRSRRQRSRSASRSRGFRSRSRRRSRSKHGRRSYSRGDRRGGDRRRSRSRRRSRDRRPRDVESMFSVLVDHLPRDCRKADLEDAFKEFGRVGDVYMPRNANGKIAYVRYRDKEDALDAVKEMDGARIRGEKVKCEMAPEKKSSKKYSPSTSRSRSRRRSVRSRSR